MLAILFDKVLLGQMSQMLVELLLQIELFVLILRYLFQLGLDLSYLLGAI